VADTQLFKLQRLEMKILHAIGKFPTCTPVYEFHMAFQVSYIYDYITKLCRQQRPYKIMKMQIFAKSKKAKPDTEYTRGVSLAAVRLTTFRVTRQPL
jgi:hypothetical protein